MIGVIAGDVIGSVHEHSLTKSTDFPLFDSACRFTDDTVLTVATAYAILTGTSYEMAYRDFGRRYPDAGYGGTFYQWLLSSEPRPYNSWGNGSAMRVAPVGLAFTSVEEVLRQAEESAAVTHSHVEGIKGARRSRWRCSWVVPAPRRKKSETNWCGVLAMTSTGISTRSGRTTSGTCLVNGPCQRPSSLSWIRIALSMPFGWRYLLAETLTHRPRSREASLMLFTDLCRRRLSVRSGNDYRRSFLR
jgi:hypothetical protein